MASGDAEAARVEACFALIAQLEDTNLLHRGGLAGLRFARDAARRFLDAGGVGQSDWRARARTVHEQFVARRLSPGGSADLLAMSTHGHRFVADVLFGATADKVRHLVKIPVLLLRAQ